MYNSPSERRICTLRSQYVLQKQNMHPGASWVIHEGERGHGCRGPLAGSDASARVRESGKDILEVTLTEVKNHRQGNHLAAL